MSRFIDARETRVIAAPWWEEGETVTIRRLSFLDRRYIAGQSTTYGESNPDGSRSVFVDTEAMDLAILERGIVEWTLAGEGGQNAPLTREMLQRLAPEDGEYIVNAIHEFNPRRSAEEQGNFRDRARDGAEE